MGHDLGARDHAGTSSTVEARVNGLCLSVDDGEPRDGRRRRRSRSATTRPRRSSRCRPTRSTSRACGDTTPSAAGERHARRRSPARSQAGRRSRRARAPGPAPSRSPTRTSGSAATAPAPPATAIAGATSATLRGGRRPTSAPRCASPSTATNSVGPTTATSERDRGRPGRVLGAGEHRAAHDHRDAARSGRSLTAGARRLERDAAAGLRLPWQRCDSGGAICVADLRRDRGELHPWSAPDPRASTMRVVVTATNGSGRFGDRAPRPPRRAVQAVRTPARAWSRCGTWTRRRARRWHDSVGGHDGTLHSVTLGAPASSGTAYGFNGQLGLRRPCPTQAT